MNKRYYEHTLSTTREFIEYLRIFVVTGSVPRFLKGLFNRNLSVSSSYYLKFTIKENRSCQRLPLHHFRQPER